MLSRRVDDVLVIGCGVAGATAAALLARAGRRVCVLDRPPPLDLVVGESLLPATVPYLRRLGIEDELGRFAQRKPGLAFIMRDGRALRFNLSRLRGFLPNTYSYNVPRPRFDRLLRERAARDGARLVAHDARLRADGDRILVDDATLAACGLRRQPDFVLDCTGRAQRLRRVLGLRGAAGPRRDLCLFAHYTGADLGVPLHGSAVVTVMDAGWSWRIPLCERMSIGVVQDAARLRALGPTAAARLDAALARDPLMAAATAHATRVTDVQVFTNYQWVADRFLGANWALVGDAAGFLDPTHSPGVLLALESAFGIAAALTAAPLRRRAALARWQARYRTALAAWQALIDYFYDGRLFASIMHGEEMQKLRPLAPLNRHIERRFAGAFLGARTASWYSRHLIAFLVDHTMQFRPTDWAVR